MTLPGVCIVCRDPVVWSGKRWRNPGQRSGRHVCKRWTDRPFRTHIVDGLTRVNPDNGAVKAYIIEVHE